MLRHGTYYFHMRLKKNDSKHQFFKSGLIRKSLKTGNYKEALQKSRLLWIQYNMTEEKINTVNPEIYEKEIQHQADMYSRGRQLHEIYQKIDKNDSNSIDEFFIQEFGASKYSTKFDEQAFQYYDEKSDSIDIHIDGHTNKSPHALKPFQLYIDKYISYKIHNLKAWKQGSHGKFSQDLSFFRWCMNNCQMKDISIDTIKSKYLDILTQIPSHLSQVKALKNNDGSLVSIDRIIEYTDKNNLEKLSNNTIKGKITTIKGFIDWCVNYEYLEDNVLKAFAFTNKIKSDSKIRYPFDANDLKKMFNRDEFYKGLHHHKYSFRHWGILIALYSGMRANEICQLKIQDIIHDNETDIYYFNITDVGKNQSVKNNSSKRQVPIHKELIKLGLINYFKEQKRKNNKGDLLFKGLTYSKVKNNHTQKLLRWFNEKYIYETGIKTRNDDVMKSFHSFRHTFINYEKQERLDGAILEEVVGHSSQKTAHDGYQKSFGLKAKQKELNKIKFDIDVENFKVFK